jgi:VanZ family protein
MAIGWTVVILVLCWMPRQQMPMSETAPSFLKLIHFDKIVHFTMFAVFAFLWKHASKRTTYLKIAVIGIALAILTEIVQGTSFVGRDCDLYDGLADSAGVGFGLLVYWFFKTPEASTA